jgi:type III secretion protein J
MKRTTFARRLMIPVMLCVTLSLTGCKEVLYSSLTEVEANEMVAILDASGISAGRQRDKEGNYALEVETDKIASAVTVLRNAGYPQQRFKSLGEVFASEGLVGTPFEERARFMFALNEELSRTISSIDGIRNARVQVMIPASEKYSKTAPVSTASVAILFESGYDLSPVVPNIKTLVAHSVPDLDYDNVAVSLFPVDVPERSNLPVGVNTPEVISMGILPNLRASPLVLVIMLLTLISGLCALIALQRRGGRA